MNLKWRVGIILGLIAASVWALFPRTVVERVKRNGEFVYDTVRRVPLKLGLDLQGGMHLALTVDESKGPVPDKSQAIEKSLPRLDAALKDAKITVAARTTAGTKDTANAGLQSLFTADTS